MISILNKKTHIISLIFLLVILPIIVNAETKDKNIVNIYFFHSRDCSHCNSEIKLLDDLEKRYDNVNIYRYEIHNKENNEIRIKVQDLYKLKGDGVPLTIIGNTPYLGYQEETSTLKFIKTIEYYSRYGYIDQVGEMLQITKLPSREIDAKAPPLDDFLKTYGNYKLIGSLSTDDFDTATSAIILGILSQFNIIKILMTIFSIIILLKLDNKDKNIYFLVMYLISSFIFNTTYLIPNNIYKIIIYIINILIIIISIIFYLKNKEKKYLYSNIIVIIAILTSYLENYYLKNNITAFKEIITLNNLTGLNKINYYGNYFFVIIIINLLIILIYQYLKINLTKKRLQN